MVAENDNGTVKFEDADEAVTKGTLYSKQFIVTTQTKWKYNDCTARFGCYDDAEQFFKSQAKKIHAREIKIPIDHFDWMTNEMEEE